MNLFEMILSNSSYAQEIGLTIMRIGVGLTFIWHGFRKYLNGLPEMQWLGDQMANLGITFFPIFWGICAATAEFVGGLCLTIGFGTRIACVFLTFTMFVAVIHHIKKGDSWGYISFPLTMLIIFVGFMIAGSGIYSLDFYLSK